MDWIPALREEKCQGVLSLRAAIATRPLAWLSRRRACTPMIPERPMSILHDADARTGLNLPPRYPVSPPVLAQGGLRLLLEASHRVRELKADDWEFAVEIECLHAAGLTNTDLRWLVSRGYALQAVERIKPGARLRTFQRVANLSLPKGTCFVLTQAGVAYALGCCPWREAGASPEEGKQSPVWDEVRRELRVGLSVVKRFKQPAANQERVLRAFEEDGWPSRIDDPLPPEPEQDSKRRLHSTISNLNRGQRRRIRVHFAGGGEGESICWQLRGAEAQGEGRAKAERG